MANQFLKLRRSSVPGKIPDTGSLDFGEIALNTHDGLAFMKKSSSLGEEVIIIGSTQGAFTGSFSGSFTGSLFGTASWAYNALTASTADNFVVRGTLTGSNALFTGTVTAQTLVVQTISSSVIYSSGSNTFGDELTDKQTFTGSVEITGSLSLNGFSVITSDQTASMSVLSASYASTASYAENAISASYVSGSAAIVTNLTSSNNALIRGVTVGSGFSTTFQNNTVLGGDAFVSNTAGSSNVAVGYLSLTTNTTGQSNTAIGAQALRFNQTGILNTAVGRQALLNLISGNYNIGIGVVAGSGLTTGQHNTIIGGFNTATSITTGNYNTIIGSQVSGLTSSLSNNIILADGQGNIKYRWDAVQNNIYGNLAVTGSVTATQGFSGSLFGTSSWALNFVTSSVTSASYAYTASSAVSSSYAYDADFLDGKDSTIFATTGSNVFKGSQTIDGNLFMSGSFRLIYNNDPTNNMLFGQFDGSQIHGPYYQLFGNQYSTVSQRGSAEFVYDTRNGGESGFNIVSFNGFGWTRRFRVDDSGAQVTGSLNVSNGITGSLFGTASWAENFVTESVTSASYAYTASSAISSSYAYDADFLDGKDSSVFATTGSNIFYGDQIISGSSGFPLQIHGVDDIPWSFGLYNDTYDPNQAIFAGWTGNDGQSYIGNEIDTPINVYTNAQYYNPTLVISSSGVTVGKGGITGSLFGTASWAENAITASHADNSISSSYSYTASSAISASYADSSLSSSYAYTASSAESASYSDTSISASYSYTASSAENAYYALSSSLAYTASSADDFVVRNSITASSALIQGTITAQTLIVQTISSSVIYSSGSNIFGDELTDKQTFTGSVDITGSLSLNGFNVITSDQTGSMSVASSSYASTASYAISASFTQNSISASYVSGSAAIVTNLTSSNDANINGLTVGAGPGGSASPFFANVVVGRSAFLNNTTGNSNIAIGPSALQGNTIGNLNLAIGSRALLANVSSGGNTAVGYGVLRANPNGEWNTGMGPYAMVNLTNGSYNTAIGSRVLYFLTSGSYNTIIGSETVQNMSSGNNNTVLGSRVNLATGTNNNIVLSDGQGNIKYRWDESQTNIYGNLAVTGSVTATQGFTGSLFGTASWALNFVTESVTSASYAYTASSAVSSSYALTASSAVSSSYAYNADFLDGKDSTVFATTGSNTFIGDQTVTGSLSTSGSNTLIGVTTLTGSFNVSGSTLQVGNNTLLGNTILTGSITISGSRLLNDPSIKIYGDVETDGVFKFLPVSYDINPSLSGSYIYVSGSTNDLYFSQNGNGFANTTRLRWLEGNLYSGLLNGGIITTQSSTVYQISSGSGIIVDLNASINDNPYPIVNYINWKNLSASIAPLSASYDQSFVAVLSNGTIGVQGIPYNDGDYNIKIPIGIVIHQNRSTINAVQTFPNVAYGWKQRSYDFIRAFGPLKISGYTLAPSGSSTRGLVLSGGTAWVDGRNYIVDQNNPSYITEGTGIVTSKIYRYRQSGSGWAYDTNAGVGYTTIDPTQYSNNGVLTPVGTNNWSIQRVYYFPNSATKAFYIYYGNASYANQAAALAAINTEPFNEAPNTAANAIYVGFMLLRNDASFTVPASYAIYEAGLFRSSGVGGGSGGGAGATALANLTDVSLSSPTDYQALVYDSITTKWENRSFISASISGNAATSTTSSYAYTASFLIGYNPYQIATGSVTASVDTNPDNVFLIKSGSVNFLNISSSGNTTLSSDLFIVKNLTSQQPVLTVSQSVVQIATHSFDPTGTTEAGSIWFTSTAMYVGLE